MKNSCNCSFAPQGAEPGHQFEKLQLHGLEHIASPTHQGDPEAWFREIGGGGNGWRGR